MTDAALQTMRKAAGLTLRDVEALVKARGLDTNSGRISLIERGISGHDKERAVILAVLTEEINRQALP